MRDICNAISGGVLIGALFGLFAVIISVAVSEVWAGWKVWRAKRHAAVLSVVAALAIIIGGTKPPKPYIQWDEGLHDNGSYIDTNNLNRIEIRWTYEAWIPNIATFTLSAVERDSTNLFTIGTAPITDRSLSAIMEREATNYLFFAEQSFVPDAPVVTNGVYHVKCVDGGRGAITNIVAEWHYRTNGVEFPVVVQPYFNEEDGLLVTPDFRLPDGYYISFWEGVVFDSTPDISEWSQDATFFNEESDEQYDVVVDARLESRTNIISGTVWVPIGLKIYGDGEAISPPSK